MLVAQRDNATAQRAQDAARATEVPCIRTETTMAGILETLLHIAPLVILAGAGSIGLAALVDRLRAIGSSRDR